MHPAPSVILFSTLSGLGFGLLAWLGLGHPAVTGWAAFGLYLMGYGLAVGGLVASTFHLGNPKNARKAFSQWRTSWLSREGVMALVSLLVVAPVAFAKVFFGTSLPILGFLGAVACLITVFTTAMIYAQLKTVPRWSTPLTPVIFLGYAVAGGALLAGQGTVAALLLLLLGVVQFLAWNVGDDRFARSGTTLASATGLGALGAVRQLEPPHSGSNYLLKEMAYEVGRKHAAKLRMIGLGLAFGLPALILLAAPFSIVWTGLAAMLHLAGVLVTRWLFFAEVKHVVSLYYGK